MPRQPRRPAIPARAAGVLILTLATAAGLAPQPGGWELIVLGRAQDAGIPHLNCDQPLCRSVRAGKRPAERVASLGLVHRATNRAYVFDATPDFVSQMGTLTGGRPPAGVFLTHGHIGHYTGLMYLGRESMDAKGVAVAGTARMAAFLRANGPWSQLVTRGNIDLRVIVPGQPQDLGDGLRVTALDVPHRDEFTDTVGFRIDGPRRSALFIPDIDQWAKWDQDIRQVASTVDYAFLDGTFASAGEVPGRAIADIPHPLMPATRALLKGLDTAVWFIHINHTNAQLDARDVVRDRMRFPL